MALITSGRFTFEWYLDRMAARMVKPTERPVRVRKTKPMGPPLPYEMRRAAYVRGKLAYYARGWVAKQADVVVMGDSNAASVDWGELLHAKHVASRAVQGLAMCEIGSLEPYIDQLAPKHLVIVAGTNDVYLNYDPVGVVNVIRPVLQRFQEAHIKIAMVATLPTAEASRQKGVDELNQHLHELCRELDIIWIDPTSRLVDGSGLLAPGLHTDEVHLSTKGVVRLAHQIRNYLCSCGAIQS